MPSRAATTFALRTGDIDRLLRIHADIAGRSAGRKYGVEVLNRSAIVLLTAMWEGYIEDVSAEALTHLVDNTSDPATLPLGLRQGVARELKADPHDLSVWQLAGLGWRAYLRGRLARDADERARGFNTPGSERVEKLLATSVGLSDVTSNWRWQHMTPADAAAKLDSMIKLREDIAHGQGHTRSVHRGRVEADFVHVKGTCGTHRRGCEGLPPCRRVPTPVLTAAPEGPPARDPSRSR